jgi:hypothetical protein
MGVADVMTLFWIYCIISWSSVSTAVIYFGERADTGGQTVVIWALAPVWFWGFVLHTLVKQLDK